MKKLILMTMLLISITSPSFSQSFPDGLRIVKNVETDFPKFMTTKVSLITESTTREDLKELGFRKTPKNEFPGELKKNQEAMDVNLYSTDEKQYLSAIVIFNLGVLHRVEIHAGIEDKKLHEDLKKLCIELHLDRLAEEYAGATFIKRGETQTERISELFEEPYREISEHLLDFSHSVDHYYFISVQHRLKTYVY
ncbi:hypothetical protein [Kiloniella majae]|uniref:hypothetical protein n=1 Tax=Kiloniella majae TaxID=1938558 RepID=UPI000A277783|nr:hypothetical protein [Kiloniella majae]